MVFKEKEQSAVWLRLLDLLMILLTVVATVSMIMVLFGGSINPSTWALPSFVILGAPFVFLANVVVLIYWVIRWKYFGMVVTGVLMLFWVWDIGAFVQARFLTTRVEASSSDIKLLTYNIHSFVNYENHESSLNAVLDFVEQENPDVICFQEYTATDSVLVNTISSRLAQWPYFANMYGVQTSYNMYDCVVFSKYPLSIGSPIVIENATGGALSVDVCVDGDTVRLYNCHLQTTSFNQVNNSKSLGQVVASEDSDQAVRGTMKALRDNFKIRSIQADTLASEIQKSPYPVIVAGDFNTVPLSYTYQRVSENLSDSFRDQGEGYGYTYRPMRGLLRIDFVLYDNDKYRCVQYNSPNKQLSDHNPVIVILKKKI